MPDHKRGASPRTTVDFITTLFWSVAKHSQALLYPSELVTIGIPYALKGCGERALTAHRAWTDYFLAEPSLLGVADSYGVELIHPSREGRSSRPLRDKGISNWRWILGAKLGFVLNHVGLFVAWDCNLASVSDQAFRPLIAQFAEQMVVLVDTGFHGHAFDPANMKVCKRGAWNTRMLIETVLSMLTTVCHLKKIAHRQADYFRARMAFILSAFNVLVQWHGLNPDEQGMVHLSIAEFSL